MEYIVSYGGEKIIITDHIITLKNPRCLWGSDRLLWICLWWGLEPFLALGSIIFGAIKFFTRQLKTDWGFSHCFFYLIGCWKVGVMKKIFLVAGLIIWIWAIWDRMVFYFLLLTWLCRLQKKSQLTNGYPYFCGMRQFRLLVVLNIGLPFLL